MCKAVFFLIKRFLTPPSCTNNYWQTRRLRRFLDSHHGILLNIGSKSRSLGDKAIYLDVQPGAHVDLVCDIHALPIKDNTVAGIVATAILEHVHSPIQAVKECYRVLSAGGGIYASIPFMYGFHADPNDFQRYTHIGIRSLFSDFEILEVAKTRGIGSTLAGIMGEFFSILFCFNNETVYRCLRYAFGWVFFLLKYLDFLTVNNRFEYIIASGFTIIARKK
jgi:SAM-dependent methyltransferase